jgi:hypothetical protein
MRSKVLEFWELYIRNEGVKNAGQVDADKVFGSLRAAQYAPLSPWLYAGRITAALRLAYSIELHKQGETDIRKLVGHWLPELRLLDPLQPNPNIFPTPIMTGALLSLRRYRVADLVGDRPERLQLRRPSGPSRVVGAAMRGKVLEFWERYIRNEGVKNAGQVDAVEALRILRTMDRAVAGKHHIIASNGAQR